MVGFITRFSNLVESIQAAASVAFVDILTANGRKFNQEYDITFGDGETRYFLYQLPADADTTVALQKRIFKTKDGEAELEIIWRATYVEGTLETVFNEYNAYDESNNQFRLSEIAAPTGGITRETDFIAASGVGANTSGDVSPDVGFRLYKPGTHFIARVTNLETSSNRILLGYTWTEIPAWILKVGIAG